VIVAWVALGSTVVFIALFAWAWKLVEGFQFETVRTFEEIRDLLDKHEPEEYSPLDEEQKRELRVTWGQVACQTCGYLHPGSCPRIREMRYQTNGNPERIIFWPDGKWAVPKGAHSYREVFGTEVPQSEEAK
jgi:hypothetical protein